MAYLLDVSLPGEFCQLPVLLQMQILTQHFTHLADDHGQACSTYSLLSGVGGCIGYLIGAIDWNGTMLGELLGGNINTVFILVTVIFVLCLAVTVGSFREIPLPLMERDELLQPLTERAVTEQRQRTTVEKGFRPMKDIADALLLELEGDDSEPSDRTALLSYSEKEPLMGDFLQEKPKSSAKEFLRITFRIPATLAVLCVTNLFCWMSHISYSLYFTDFVGEKVFGGDPMAHSDSDEYALYIEGVRYGCFGMAIYSIACSTYSCTIERLIRVFRARNVYSGGLLIDFVGMLLMAMFPSKVTVYVFSVTGGIVGALLFTMPYIILAKYHAKGLVRYSVVCTLCALLKNGTLHDTFIAARHVRRNELDTAPTWPGVGHFHHRQHAVRGANHTLAYDGPAGDAHRDDRVRHLHGERVQPGGVTVRHPDPVSGSVEPRGEDTQLKSAFTCARHTGCDSETRGCCCY